MTTNPTPRPDTDLVVNLLVKVLDEDVSLASLAESGVTLAPHDAAGAVLDQRVVEVLEGTLTVSRVEVVDVSVAERAAGNSVAADTDRSHRANEVEDLEEHGLSDGSVELADVERSRVARLLGTRGGSGSGLSRLALAASGGSGGRSRGSSGRLGRGGSSSSGRGRDGLGRHGC
jgi:hypothetical protein